MSTTQLQRPRYREQLNVRRDSQRDDTDGDNDEEMGEDTPPGGQINVESEVPSSEGESSSDEEMKDDVEEREGYCDPVNLSCLNDDIINMVNRQHAETISPQELLAIRQLRQEKDEAFYAFQQKFLTTTVASLPEVEQRRILKEPTHSVEFRRLQ
ncbi:uncharacterized protein CCR75_009045 [Bremia lactucae]|uniref:Uncharacterized protein n=1 Tax=Bremia lactucae TaxID=4779 RepID=A0A976FDE1_BRELC|nr:hypothetical protein CCR75_009045 [Bremia lactucae]